MRQVTIFLLAFACVLAYFGWAQAECCRTSLKLYYNVQNGNCADVGGHRRDSGSGCEVTICADGKPKMYFYCGKKDCNAFGCDCKDGCRTGDWKLSFLANNHQKIINVTDEYWPKYI